MILVTGFLANAQKSSSRKADKLFAKYEFVKAADAYQKVINKGGGNEYVYSQLAEAYYNVFNSLKAEKWYAKALETSQDPEMIFKYSQMLKANGQYVKSNDQMAKFASMRPSDNRSLAFLNNPNYLLNILDDGEKFTFFPENGGSIGKGDNPAEFGGTLLITENDSTLYISSSRSDIGKKYGWDQNPFLDIYKSRLVDGKLLKPVPVEELNTKYHEGLVSFSPNGKTMYFSRESYYDKIFERDSLSKNKYSVINLYKSTQELGVWSEGEALSLNNEKYSVKNPAVSNDGKTLFFASDMQGGFGNFDIYYAPINEDGSVGKPTNMGGKVNTGGQEMFPFVSSKNELFFSSNGHMGLGGLDVFFGKLIDDKIGPIRNVGLGVNSNSDDFSFSVYYHPTESKRDLGFVSTNDFENKDCVRMFTGIICDVLVNVTVRDSETKEVLVGAIVNFTDTEGNIISSKTTSEKGEVNYIVECDTDLYLTASMEQYESGSTHIKGSSEEEITGEILLDPIDEIILANKVILNPIYFDFDKSNITAKGAFELDKLVALMNKYESIVIRAESHTDARGTAKYNQSLSERRALTTAQYVISQGIDASRISGVGMGEAMPVNDCGSRFNEDEHQMNRRSEFIILEGNPNNE